MIYRAIGLMSGSSLDGLDITSVEFEETRGEWKYEIKAADCIAYDKAWTEKLQTAKSLNAFDYLYLHSTYGKYIGEQVNAFIDTHQLHHKVQLITSHGHTVFHAPDKGFTAQLGDGAAIAAITEINVVSDLRALDVALKGQGAPIVPMGEKLLWKDYDYFLNIGGIANLSANSSKCIAYDVCPANRILNMLSQDVGLEYDNGGALAATGAINNRLFEQLNAQAYYELPAPKSLDNAFGTDIIYPLIKSAGISIKDALHTYVAHIVFQVQKAAMDVSTENISPKKMLVTGGGAFNTFLVEQLSNALEKLNIEVIVPDENLVKYKEALIMALLGILRWREENTIFNSVTGATRSSIGGAVWMGQAF